MSTTNVCPACSATEPDGLLCQRCWDQVASALHELPGLMRELDVMITRQSQTGTGNGGRGGSDPLLYDWSASHTRDDVINTITTWVRELSLGDTQHLGASFRSWCRWLTDRRQRICGHVAAQEIHDELTYMVQDVRRTIDTAGLRALYGKCEVCDRDIMGKPDAIEVSCRYCALEGIDITYDADDRRTGMWNAAKSMLLDQRTIIAALPIYGHDDIPATTVRSWINRKRLPQRTDPKRPGARVYLLDDALRLANLRAFILGSSTRQRKRRRRVIRHAKSA